MSKRSSQRVLTTASKKSTTPGRGLFNIQTEILSKLFFGQCHKGRRVCKWLRKELPFQQKILNMCFLLRSRILNFPSPQNLEVMTVSRLRKICLENGIAFHKNKAGTIKNILEFSTTSARDILAGIANNRDEYRKTVTSIVYSGTQVKTRLSLRLNGPINFSIPKYRRKDHATLGEKIDYNIQDFDHVPNLTDLDIHVSNTCNPEFLDAVVDVLTTRLGTQVSSLACLKFNGYGKERDEGLDFSGFFECGLIAAERLALCFQLSPQLTRFHMSYCELEPPAATSLFSGLAHATQLTELNLSRFAMEESCMDPLAAALPKLSALTSLRMHGFCRSEFMSYSFSPMMDVAQSLRYIPSLTALELSSNELRNEGAIALAESLRSLNKLARLAAVLCPRSRTVILNALQHTPLLTSLDVGDTGEVYTGRMDLGFDSEGGTELAAALHWTPLLTHLGLAGAGLEAVGLKAIARALPETPALTSLNLAGLTTGEGLQELLGAVPRLSIVNLHCGRFNTRNDVEALCAGLRSVTGLESLDLGCSHWSRDKLEAIAGSLSTASRLSCLRLDQASIAPSGADNLASLLRNAQRLVKLNLGENALGDKGIKALAPALGAATALTDLCLRANSLGGAGSVVLAAALKQLTELKTLDLSNNDLRGAGAVRVAESLRGATALSELDLAGNDLGEEAMTKVTRILARAELHAPVHIRCP
jgi:hypothetical protein